jgi:hypothetical protein
LYILTFPDSNRLTYSVCPEPEYISRSKNPLSKSTKDDEYADIVIPKLPEDAGNTTDAEVGVIVIPVPSDVGVVVSEKYLVVDPIDGLTCILALYAVKSTGSPFESRYSILRVNVEPWYMVKVITLLLDI